MFDLSIYTFILGRHKRTIADCFIQQVVAKLKKDIQMLIKNQSFVSQLRQRNQTSRFLADTSALSW